MNEPSDVGPRTGRRSDYVEALEDECARANVLVGVLRLAAKGHVMAGPDYSLYRQYLDSREHRFDVQEQADTGSQACSHPDHLDALYTAVACPGCQAANGRRPSDGE